MQTLIKGPLYSDSNTGLDSEVTQCAIVGVQVRNHILTRWRADVTRFLHEEEAALKVQPKYRHLVSLAWKFLFTHGYINFGVAPAITQHPTPEQQVSVVVIGAGLAGQQ
jgi:lysine-specific histone demethylase 1